MIKKHTLNRLAGRELKGSEGAYLNHGLAPECMHPLGTEGGKGFLSPPALGIG